MLNVIAGLNFKCDYYLFVFIKSRLWWRLSITSLTMVFYKNECHVFLHFYSANKHSHKKWDILYPYSSPKCLVSFACFRCFSSTTVCLHLQWCNREVRSTLLCNAAILAAKTKQTFWFVDKKNIIGWQATWSLYNHHSVVCLCVFVAHSCE